MKIISSGKALHSPEYYKKKKKSEQVRRIFYSILVLVLVGLVVYVLNLERLRISEVSVDNGGGVIDTEVVTLASSLLDGRYYFLIPRSNAIFYPREAIREAILERFPAVKKVRLNLEGFKTLFIVIEERRPFSLYCEDAPNLSGCYFMDEDGFIFSLAPQVFQRGTFLVFSADEPLLEPLGTNFIPSEEFVRILEFIEQIAILGLEAKGLRLGSDEYGILLKNNGELIWRQDTPLEVVLSNLEAFFSSETISSQPSFRERLRRLDLRVTNRVFYRLDD